MVNSLSKLAAAHGLTKAEYVRELNRGVEPGMKGKPDLKPSRHIQHLAVRRVAVTHAQDDHVALIALSHSTAFPPPPFSARTVCFS